MRDAERKGIMIGIHLENMCIGSLFPTNAWLPNFVIE